MTDPIFKADLADAAKVGILAIDEGDRLVYANQAFADLVGIPIHALIGSTAPFPFWPPENVAEIQTRRARVRAAAARGDRQAATSKTIFLHASGRRFPMLMQVGVLKTQAVGQLWVTTTEDLTVYEAQNEAIRRNEILIRTMVENLEEVFYASSGNQSVLEYVSPSFERVWGIPVQELYRNPRRYVDAILPEYLPAVEAADAAQSRGEVHPVEYEILRPDGTKRRIRDTSYPILGPDGRVERVVGIATDITDRHAVEMALRAERTRLEFLLSSSIGVVYSCRIDGDYAPTFMSGNVEALTGFPAERFLADARFWLDRIHPEDAARVLDGVAAMLPHRPRYSHEYRWRHADGSYRWMRDELRTIVGEDGRPRELVGLWTDQHERREALSLLEVSESRLREAQAVAHIGSWHLDCRTDALDWSEETYRISGRDPARGITLAEFNGMVPDEDRKVIAGAWERALTSGHYEVEHRFLTPFGVRWIRERARLDLGADGRALRAVGTAQDITLEREREQALSASERRLSRALKTGRLGLWEWRPGSPGDVTSMGLHSSYIQLLGYGAEELRAMANPRLDLIHPDDLGRVKNAFRDYAVGRTSQYRNEYRVKAKDGRWIWIASSAEPVVRDEQGKLVRIVGTHLDITDRKQQELEMAFRDELISNAQDLAGVGYATRDAVTGAVYRSPKMYELLEWPTGDAPPGPGMLLERVHPEDRPTLATWLGDGAPADHGQGECRLLLPSGMRHAQWRVFLQRDADGRPLRKVTTLQDITRLHRARDIEREAQKMEAISRLAAGMAHDFNNLLGVIVGNLELLEREGGLGGAQAKAVSTALSAALRGGEVTRSLVTMSGERPYEERTFELTSHLRELLPLLVHSAGAKVNVSEDLGDLALLVRADPTGFDTAIVNVVVNARDAMPGGGSIHLQLRPREPGDGGPALPERLARGRYIEVLVSDTGSGMSEDVLQRAFDPFFTTKERGRGTGLGLALVMGYFQQLGGGVMVDSKPGRGTTLRLYVPLIGDAAVAAPCPKAAPTAQTGPLRVLLVEDERPLRDVGAALLRSRGHQVVAVANGAAGKAALEEESFDVMVCDLVMPGELDGVALARWAAEHQPGLGIVIVTGLADQAGALNLPWKLMRKPFRAEALFEAVQGSLPQGLPAPGVPA